MNLRLTIRKEVHTSLYPWLVVAIAGFLPLWAGNSMPAISLFVALIGLPLLAALPLGSEFEHRTFSVLLSQPISRSKIWSQKLTVTMLAVVSAALPYAVSVWFVLPNASQRGDRILLLWAECLVVATCSATFWTVKTRSTMGGLVLTLFSLILVDFGWNVAYSGPRFASSALEVWFFILTLFYGVVMLVLGRRELLQFEATGGLAGEDLLTAGPKMMPGALSDMFRSRPTGVTANLIRKELHLLRPVWLITALFILCWTARSLIAEFYPSIGGSGTVEVLILNLLYLPLTVILAGALSQGEERSSGMHSWHLTLPVSVRRQWLIKWGVAVVVSEVCGLVIPILVIFAERFLFGSPFSDYQWIPDRIALGLMFATVFLLSCASFLSASAVKGTARAAIWTFPLVGSVYVAAIMGVVSQVQLVRMKVPVAHLTLRAIGMIFPGNAGLHYLPTQWRIAPVPQLIGAGWLILVPTLFALFESYRLFRTQPKEGMLPAIRLFLPLVGVAFICGFLL